ncbi:metal-dependent hydrolase [Haloferax sp. S1W]|uniref:metal-dependent hydrolase n=1 Tax=Haloferax sp. S1W TaxID=3377110 RepID=UPI0037C6CE68
MMATTHALAGVALGTAVMALVPEAGIIPVLAAALGGLFPDFDLYAGHRKTLHFPVYFSALAVPALAVAAVNPTTTSLAVALFLAAAAVHSVSDIFGGGLELKPWLGTSERAVYDHWNGRWLAPKRLIRYDGSPEDLALTLVLAVPPVLVFDGTIELLVIGAVAISGVYVLLRKPMVVAAERLVAALPDHVVDYVPERFIRDLR